jgi:hypothetical protein
MVLAEYSQLVNSKEKAFIKERVNQPPCAHSKVALWFLAPDLLLNKTLTTFDLSPPPSSHGLRSRGQFLSLYKCLSLFCERPEILFPPGWHFKTAHGSRTCSFPERLLSFSFQNWLCSKSIMSWYPLWSNSVHFGFFSKTSTLLLWF